MAGAFNVTGDVAPARKYSISPFGTYKSAVDCAATSIGSAPSAQPSPHVDRDPGIRPQKCHSVNLVIDLQVELRARLAGLATTTLTVNDLQTRHAVGVGGRQPYDGSTQ